MASLQFLFFGEMTLSCMDELVQEVSGHDKG